MDYQSVFIKEFETLPKTFSKRERVDIAMMITQEIGKDVRQSMIEPKTRPATDAQKKLLLAYGITNTENMTVREASRKIDELTRKR